MLYFSIGLENYNYIYPHIDTEFTTDFKKESFDKIEVGMTRSEVEMLLGKSFGFDSLNGYTDNIIKKEYKYLDYYSHDGKFEFADFAWEFYGIYYDRDTLVINKQTRWYYD